jgi:hypothetical protein
MASSPAIANVDARQATVHARLLKLGAEADQLDAQYAEAMFAAAGPDSAAMTRLADARLRKRAELQVAEDEYAAMTEFRRRAGVADAEAEHAQLVKRRQALASEAKDALARVDAAVLALMGAQLSLQRLEDEDEALANRHDQLVAIIGPRPRYARLYQLGATSGALMGGFDGLLPSLERDAATVAAAIRDRKG